MRDHSPARVATLFGCVAVALTLGACSDDGPTDAGMPDGATMDGPAVGDAFIRADVRRFDGREFVYEDVAITAPGGCGGAPGGPDLMFSLLLVWGEGTTPSLGAHPTGGDENIDIIVNFVTDDGTAGARNVGEADDMNPGGTVTFTEFGDVVAGTFSASFNPDSFGGIPIESIRNGEFRCVR